MSTQQPPLDFELLDDVLPGLTATCPLREELVRSRPAAVGPIVEYAFQRAARPHCLPPLSAFKDSLLAAALSVIQAGAWDRQPKTTSLESQLWEFSRIPPDGTTPDPYWTAFLQRVKHASQSCGFSPNSAKQFAGVVGEMVDNVWQHSGAPGTAVAGYRRGAGEFEFVIADAGVGVVTSLNRYPEYSELSDAGTALMTALTLADSPYGRRTGRGEGYRRMFANLMNRWGTLRFRSGDHGLHIARRPHRHDLSNLPV